MLFARQSKMAQLFLLLYRVRNSLRTCTPSLSQTVLCSAYSALEILQFLKFEKQCPYALEAYTHPIYLDSLYTCSKKKRPFSTLILYAKMYFENANPGSMQLTTSKNFSFFGRDAHEVIVAFHKVLEIILFFDIFSFAFYYFFFCNIKTT